MPADHYDAIIVGSGAGGAAAAYHLVNAGRRVLLLEKGNDLPRDGSTLDIDRVVHRGEFLSKEVWHDGAGTAFAPEEHFNVGGKTKWYGAALLRFSRAEFAADAAHGCHAWPIDYDDLEPYYTHAEQLLGVRRLPVEPGLQNILSKLCGLTSPWQADPMPMGLSSAIGGYPLEARHFDGFASVAGLKGEADVSLLAPLRGRANFTLRVGAEVVALCGDPQQSTRVTGVRLADGRELHATNILLAAGALHSPRLLARYLDATTLASTLPAARNVGRNLKLHLLTAMVSMGVLRQSDLIRKTMVITHAQFKHSSVQPLGFDGELMGTLIPKFVPRWLATQLGARSYGFFLQTEDGSDANNRVFETRGDAEVTRVMDYNASRLATATAEHRGFTQALRTALLRTGLLSFTQRIGLAGTAHACGTLIAGDDPETSVVSARGGVHGMHGLFVVDGSILPRSSRVNPSLSIYAWGLRVADLLTRQ